jgi:hypothetical protein
VYLHKEDVCSCFCKRNGHCLADSSCAACYEGCLTREGEELLYGCHCVSVVEVLVGKVVVRRKASSDQIA